MQNAMEDASEFEWSSDEARAAYQSIYDAVKEIGNAIFAKQTFASLTSEYHQRTERYLRETAELRHRAAEIARKFATRKPK